MCILTQGSSGKNQENIADVSEPIPSAQTSSTEVTVGPAATFRKSKSPGQIASFIRSIEF